MTVFVVTYENNFSLPVFLFRSTSTEPAISVEDRRLLLRKLFGNRKRTFN